MPRGSAPLDKRTLRQRCTTHVRDLIITGGLKPGDHLIETRLSEEMGVSRSTLREALRPLENEGLLVDDGKGHMLVRQISGDEILEVFQVRGALEDLAAKQLAARDDRAETAAQLRAALEPLRDERLDFASQIEADLGFHELLCRLTGNATLVSSWRLLIGQIEMMIIAAGPALASGRMRYDEHEVIVQAIESGDVERARAVLHDHMSDFASRYHGDTSTLNAVPAAAR